MRRPPVIYRPDPLPKATPEPVAETHAVMHGRIHRAHRYTGRGWILGCSGRFLRYDRVIGYWTLEEFDSSKYPNALCAHCWGAR